MNQEASKTSKSSSRTKPSNAAYTAEQRWLKNAKRRIAKNARREAADKQKRTLRYYLRIRGSRRRYEARMTEGDIRPFDQGVYALLKATEQEALVDEALIEEFNYDETTGNE